MSRKIDVKLPHEMGDYGDWRERFDKPLLHKKITEARGRPNLGGGSMTLNEFQALSRRTFKGKGANISNAALGIAGEAGEIADYVKKCLYQGHQYDVAVMVEELGDLLFYIANMATLCGVTLEDVAKFNYKKLLERYPNGFEVERSVNREG